MGKFRDLTGMTFSYLTVVKRSSDTGNGKKPRTKWDCVCKCGNTVCASTTSLVEGTTKSCGCKKRKHGHENKERLYEIWKNMRRRCNDQTNKRYESYGGKGVTICKEWDDYSVFRDWSLQNGYSDDLTIDRIDVDGNYSPDNCRWATSSEQANNMTTNRNITYNGETMTMSEWAKRIGIPYGAMSHRVQRGWSMEKIVSTPLMMR